MKFMLFHASWVRLPTTIAFVVMIAACSKPAPAPEPIRSVKVMAVGLGPSQVTIEYAGEVRPRVESRLGFRVGGKLIERNVELGQTVRVGQVLARLDPQDLKLAADAARAQVAAALTNRDLVGADLKRYQELRAQNFISGAELERRESSLKAAQAQLDQARAQLTAQGNQSTYSVLRADAPGVVTAVLAETGQIVGAGSVVLQVAQDGARDVVFSVPEDKVMAFKVGVGVLIKVWSSGQTVKAKVRELAASADSVTRTFLVKAALTGQDQLPLGSTVSVLSGVPQLAGQSAIKVPTSALKQEGQQSTVWVLDTTNMTVKSRAVQVANVDGNEVVLSGGLNVGEQVVVAGVHVLAPGQRVSLYKDMGQEVTTNPVQPSGPLIPGGGSSSARIDANAAAVK